MERDDASPAQMRELLARRPSQPIWPSRVAEGRKGARKGQELNEKGVGLL